jgi:ADP-heptose:LPS heptosyltransferase
LSILISNRLTSVPWVDRVITLRQASSNPWWARAFQLGRTLRSYRFDLAVVSNPKKELHIAVYLAGVQWRVGYDRKWGCLLTHRLSDRKALGDRHEVEYNLDLVRALRLPTSVPQWRWPCFEREQADVFQLLEQQGIKSSEPFIAVHPWTSNPIKQWPVDRYRTLIQRASERLSVRIALIGNPEERHHAKTVLPCGVPVADLVDRLTLRHLAALLQRARLLISNDSGPVHLAAALNTKTVVLFGMPSAATGPHRWGPWGEGHTVIWKRAVDAITVDEAFTALQRALQQPG